MGTYNPSKTSPLALIASVTATSNNGATTSILPSEASSGEVVEIGRPCSLRRMKESPVGVALRKIRRRWVFVGCYSLVHYFVVVVRGEGGGLQASCNLVEVWFVLRRVRL